MCISIFYKVYNYFRNLKNFNCVLIVISIIFDLKFIFILGVGKNYKDVVSVWVFYFIFLFCGIYYFEVRIISKGRDG